MVVTLLYYWLSCVGWSLLAVFARLGLASLFRDIIRARQARYRLLVHPVNEMDYRQCSYVDEVARVAMGYVLLRAWSPEEVFQSLELSSFLPVLLTAGFIGYISQLMLAIIEMQVRMWGTNMAAGLIESLKAIAAEVDAANRTHQAGIAEVGC